MESNFFSGSENIYKYLVSIGILMLVLTIYYPLKEKQNLEILKISLESEIKVLNFEIKKNVKNVDDLKKYLHQKNTNSSEARKFYSQIDNKQKANQLKQIIIKGKIVEIENRQKYIDIYDKLFWTFILSGALLVLFGFFNWYKSKKIDDEKCEIELKILKSKLAKELENNNSTDNDSPL